MSLIISTTTVSIIEWSGVTASLTGSVLHARGRRSSFVFWTLTAVLLGMVAFTWTGRDGWPCKAPGLKSTFMECATGRGMRRHGLLII